MNDKERRRRWRWGERRRGRRRREKGKEQKRKSIVRRRREKNDNRKWRRLRQFAAPLALSRDCISAIYYFRQHKLNVIHVFALRLFVCFVIFDSFSIPFASTNAAHKWSIEQHKTIPLRWTNHSFFWLLLSLLASRLFSWRTKAFVIHDKKQEISARPKMMNAHRVRREHKR